MFLLFTPRFTQLYMIEMRFEKCEYIREFGTIVDKKLQKGRWLFHSYKVAKYVHSTSF